VEKERKEEEKGKSLAARPACSLSLSPPWAGPPPRGPSLPTPLFPPSPAWAAPRPSSLSPQRSPAERALLSLPLAATRARMSAPFSSPPARPLSLLSLSASSVPRVSVLPLLPFLPRRATAPRSPARRLTTSRPPRPARRGLTPPYLGLRLHLGFPLATAVPPHPPTLATGRTAAVETWVTAVPSPRRPLPSLEHRGVTPVGKGCFNMYILSLFNTNFILHFNSVCL
jgi:hypothetical protein